MSTGESILPLGGYLVPRGIGVIEGMGHGVCDLQKVKEVDGRSGWGGGYCGYVGSRRVGRQGRDSAANSEGAVYLRHCKLGFQLSQPQGGSLLAKQQGAPVEPPKQGAR